MIRVDDREHAWQPGMTVADLLQEIDHTHVCAAVRMNGRLVSSPSFEKTTVPDHAEIYLLPLIAGG